MIVETVILLHCSGSSGAQWRSLALRLAGRFRVLTPDLIGYGSAAPWAGRGEFCLAQEAAPIRGMIGMLEEPVHLVGHSYGGAVALHIARTRPDLLRSLTLVEPSAFHLLRGGDEFDQAALDEIGGVAAVARETLASGDYMRAFGHFVDYWSGPGAWAAMPAEKREQYAPQLHKVALDFHALLNEPADLEHVKDIDLPTLLVQGSGTTLAARSVCKRLREALPAAQFRVVQGAGHMAPVTHRDEVNRLIAAHLDAVGTEWLEVANG
jgi:pimeloyl-ACP methyl ester carboxylesterase